MLDDILKKFNRQLKDKDEQIIIPIVRGYIQEFVESNYDRRLTEMELEKLSWLVWEVGEQHIWDWLDNAVREIIKDSGLKKNNSCKGGKYD